jgi:predicted ribosomally synthesized peptide with SipW-like signal peptide
MNKKIALSAVSIITSLALMSGAAFAFFSDTSTSTGNVFAAGELELLLDDNDEGTPSATVSQSLSFSGFVPGVSDTKSISLHNDASTIAIAEVELDGDKTADDGDGDLLENVIDLQIKTGTDSGCTTGDLNHTAAITAAIGDGLAPLTLAELLATSGYDALPGLTPGQTRWVCFTSTMRATAGNEYQGDSVTFSVNFTGNQDSSQ